MRHPVEPVKRGLKDQKTANLRGGFLPILTELYYSIYVLLFRASWGNSNARIGFSIGAISALKSLFALAMIGWLEVAVRERFHIGSWTVLAGFLVIYCGDFWFLLISGKGTKFERQFDKMPKTKRDTLRVAALGIVTITCIFFCLSLMFYLRVFPPKIPVTDLQGRNI